MKRCRTLVVAGFWTVALLAVTGGASVVNPTIRCLDTVTCVLEDRDFPGGTIAIDVDTIGPLDDIAGRWQLNDATSTRRFCDGRFTVGDPPRSWTCDGVPAGTVTLSSSVADDGGAEHRIGLRY